MQTDEITWSVMAVFDPDGTGGDFAYTVGLADRGHCELHLWGRPTDGTDPGADFKLSARDAGGLLNETARQLVRGEVGVGSTFVQEYDAGLAHGTFTLGDPVPPDQVDAFQVREGAEVIPIRWSLERPPAGARREPPARALVDLAILRERVQHDPVALTEGLASLGPAMRHDICGERAIYHAVARVEGLLHALDGCSSQAAEDARTAVDANPTLLVGLRGRDRREYAAYMGEMTEAVLSVAYTRVLVGEPPESARDFSSLALVRACLDPAQAHRRFWSSPAAAAVRDRARRLGPSRLARLASETALKGDDFAEQLWWAAGRSAGAGHGAPAVRELELLSLVPASARGFGEADRGFVADAIAGAALAAAAQHRFGIDPDDLADPWNAVLGGLTE